MLPRSVISKPRMTKGSTLMPLGAGAALCYMSLVIGGALPGIAQGVPPPATPISFDNCLRKKKELAEAAKQAGDKAWSIVRALVVKPGNSELKVR